MDATPSDFLAHYPADDTADQDDSLAGLEERWTALHAAAEVVASLAEVPTEPAMPIAGASGWRLALARQGIDDIVAMLEPGLSALLRLHAQGGDPRAAAKALWHEFDHARQTVLALAQPVE